MSRTSDQFADPPTVCSPPSPPAAAGSLQHTSLPLRFVPQVHPPAKGAWGGPWASTRARSCPGIKLTFVQSVSVPNCVATACSPPRLGSVPQHQSVPSFRTAHAALVPTTSRGTVDPAPSSRHRSAQNSSSRPRSSAQARGVTAPARPGTRLAQSAVHDARHARHEVARSRHEAARSRHEVARSRHEVARSRHEVARSRQMAAVSARSSTSGCSGCVPPHASSSGTRPTRSGR
jgi:hypothetical protein